MINLFFVVHDHLGARTYADELLFFFSGNKSINFYAVFPESRYFKEYNVISVDAITEIHLPRVSVNNRSLEKYSDRCLDLMDSLLIGKENLIFHLNYATQVKLGIKARERYGAKLIYTLHFLPDYFSFAENESIMELEKRVDVLELDVVREADRVICVTGFAQNIISQLCQVPEYKIVTIHNGFGKSEDNKPMSGWQKKALKKIMGFHKDEQLILFVGAFEERKGLKFLAKAFNTLSRRIPNVRLVVVGGGNLNYVFDHIKGCWGKITLTGKISHEEVFQLYQIATIGVIPSVYEQCSYVALEMMKYGLPVVVADAPGLNELYVHGEDSLIISRHKISDDSLQMILHEDELKTALATLLTKSKQRNKFSENIRNKWERKHTAVIMGQQTLIEYSKLIQ